MKDVTDVLNDNMRAYGQTVIAERALPSVVDGLKPTLRRSLYTAHKYFKSKKVKVANLTGRTMELVPTGPDGTGGAISLAAREWAGSNNHALFSPIGAVGSRVHDGWDSIAAPRYLSVELSSYAHKFLFTDSEIWSMQDNYDETTDEVEFFLPVIPMCLINGARGIAFGVATNILPYKVSDLKKVARALIEGRKPTEPKPYFRGFKGKVERVPYVPNKFVTRGKIQKERNNTWLVEDLPIGMGFEKFIAKLEKLKGNGKIVAYSDLCTDKFLFKIGTKVNQYTEDEMHKILGLTTIHSQSLNLVGPDKNLMSFNSVVDLIDVFLQIRLAKMHDLRTYWIDHWEREVTKNEVIQTCIRFLMVEHGRFGDRKSMVEWLWKKLKIPAATIEDVQAAVSIPAYKLTTEGRATYQVAASLARDELADWKAKNPVSMLLNRMDEMAKEDK